MILVVLHPALPALLVALVGLCLSALRSDALLCRMPALWALPSGLVMTVFRPRDLVEDAFAGDPLARNLAGRGPPPASS